MHDLDRSTLEANNFDYEDEFDYEMDNESDYESDYEYDYEYDYESGGSLSEEEEAEFAFELLEVSNDQEMDEFFKKFLSKIKSTVDKVAPGALNAIGKGLKKVAKTALPIAGGLAGSFFGGPVGKTLGTKAGSMISNLFEIELEGLSPEDQEFEVAKRVVRFGDEAARNTLNLAQRMPIDQATQIGFKQAAASHAPGMLKQLPVRDHRTRTGVNPSQGRGGAISATGRWVRKGNHIILMDV